MSNLELLTKRIHELVPSSMELTFGCEVMFNKHRTKVIQEEYVEESNGCKSFILRYEENDKFEEMRIGREYPPEEGDGDWMYDFEILGHPITLSDVLRAMEQILTDNGIYTKDAYEQVFLQVISDPGRWDLTKNLSEQSQETIDFLWEIIKQI